MLLANLLLHTKCRAIHSGCVRNFHSFLLFSLFSFMFLIWCKQLKHWPTKATDTMESLFNCTYSRIRRHWYRKKWMKCSQGRIVSDFFQDKYCNVYKLSAQYRWLFSQYCSTVLLFKIYYSFPRLIFFGFFFFCFSIFDIALSGLSSEFTIWVQKRPASTLPVVLPNLIK